VEQAIFTLAERDGEAGYRVVARSAGVCAADARELVVWEPSRDSLLELGPEPESFNFHPLPSGAYCVSRSVPAGWERGGGQRVYTHCLIVPGEVLTRFANNPFALIQAMTEHNLWLHPESHCPRLEPFSLPGGAVPVDQALLRTLAIKPGPERMAALVQQACHAVCVAIAGVRQPLCLMAGLFSCLPPECRLEFSFSIGLKFSPWRPFRLVVLSDDPAERLWVAGYPNVTVLELGEHAAPSAISLDGWATLVERTLATDRISFLAGQISRRRFDLTLDDLPALGLQLLESLDCLEFPSGAGVNMLDQDVAQPPPAVKYQAGSSLGVGQRAHAAHRRVGKSAAPGGTTWSAVRHPDHAGLHPPQVLEKLEHLDDLVYEAISGEAASLEQLRTLWPKLLGELGDDYLAESREQYLRYALSIWAECVDAGNIREPARAIQVLEVLSLLFGDAA
jgi:hypothetical protein